jgi:hypothetical protein
LFVTRSIEEKNSQKSSQNASRVCLSQYKVAYLTPSEMM